MPHTRPVLDIPDRPSSRQKKRKQSSRSNVDTGIDTSLLTSNRQSPQVALRNPKPSTTTTKKTAKPSTSIRQPPKIAPRKPEPAAAKPAPTSAATTVQDLESQRDFLNRQLRIAQRTRRATPEQLGQAQSEIARLTSDINAARRTTQPELTDAQREQVSARGRALLSSEVIDAARSAGAAADAKAKEVDLARLSPREQARRFRQRNKTPEQIELDRLNTPITPASLRSRPAAGQALSNASAKAGDSLDTFDTTLADAGQREGVDVRAQSIQRARLRQRAANRDASDQTQTTRTEARLSDQRELTSLERRVQIEQKRAEIRNLQNPQDETKSPEEKILDIEVKRSDHQFTQQKNLSDAMLATGLEDLGDISRNVNSAIFDSFRTPRFRDDKMRLAVEQIKRIPDPVLRQQTAQGVLDSKTTQKDGLIKSIADLLDPFNNLKETFLSNKYKPQLDEIKRIAEGK